ncbi:phage tail protein [Pantoea stewartii]|uniref:phage tail protein n=1 Tax=Pantoea stewartii TaxID=66269 RepID=UPI002DBA0133|nr:phage tail protein [Pantoea stewartii]MEB6533277.1 phage tail protein [Pantoea stewartii]
MADEPQKVVVQASRIDDTMLPSTFTLAYRLYVIQQGGDLKNVADASNNANDVAYQATVKNQEQDVILDNHGVRLSQAESELTNHEGRITNAEASIVSISSRVSNAEKNIISIQSDLSSAKSSIASIQSDYVSKSATTNQTLAGSLSVSTSYSVNGTKVLGVRVTGFTAATGSALKGSFNADASYSVGSTYSQSQIQAIASDLTAARQRIKALEDAMRSHGLIN